MLGVFSTSPQDPPGSPALDLRPLSSVIWALTFSAGRTLCGSGLQSLVSWPVPVQIRVLSPGSASWSGPVVFSSQDVTETEAPQLFILAWKSSTRKKQTKSANERIMTSMEDVKDRFSEKTLIKTHWNVLHASPSNWRSWSRILIVNRIHKHQTDPDANINTASPSVLLYVR